MSKTTDNVLKRAEKARSNLHDLAEIFLKMALNTKNHSNSTD
jgi:hypothetical protein